MALRGLVKSTQAVAGASAGKSASVAHLYRAFSKELPRVMTIYDVDMPLNEAKKAVAYHFRKHANVKDPRIITMLMTKGYMELEETLMQWKQKSHLMRLLEPLELRPKRKLTEMEKIVQSED